MEPRMYLEGNDHSYGDIRDMFIT